MCIHGENEDAVREEQVIEWRQHLFPERASVKKATRAACDIPAQDRTGGGAYDKATQPFEAAFPLHVSIC